MCHVRQEKNVRVKNSKVIYELIDYVYDEAEKAVPADNRVDVFARSKILKLFAASKKNKIIGCFVLEGEIRTNDQFCIKDGENIIATGFVEKLKIEKNEVNKVVPGNECGMSVITSYEIQEGNILEFYKESQIKKKLKRI